MFDFAMPRLELRPRIVLRRRAPRPRGRLGRARERLERAGARMTGTPTARRARLPGRFRRPGARTRALSPVAFRFPVPSRLPVPPLRLPLPIRPSMPAPAPVPVRVPTPIPVRRRSVLRWALAAAGLALAVAVAWRLVRRRMGPAGPASVTGDTAGDAKPGMRPADAAAPGAPPDAVPPASAPAWLRSFVTRRFNPAVERLGLVGGRRSAWAYLEHVGRSSGAVYRTPVLPRIADGHAYVPLSYGVDVNWARNVRAAGHCRLQLHDTIYELDEPATITAAEHPGVPDGLRPALVRRGNRYLRLKILSEKPGSLDARPLQAPEADATEPGVPSSPA